MMYEVPFRAEHVFQMKIQTGQEWVEKHLELDDIRTLENEWATTLMEKGKPLICVGPMVYWSNRALIWSFIGDMITTTDFLKIHFRAKRYIASLPFNRLEAAIDTDFAVGHRWIKLLGFKLEAKCMKAYQLDGRDSSLYSRINT